MEQYRDEIVGNHQKLIALPSLYEKEGKVHIHLESPIGKALERFLRYPKKWDLKPAAMTAVGTVKWGNEGKQIGILTHIDVIPPGGVDISAF